MIRILRVLSPCVLFSFLSLGKMNPQQEIFQDQIIKEQAQFLEQGLHCKLYSSQFKKLPKLRQINSVPHSEKCSKRVIEKNRAYCCESTTDLLSKIPILPLKVDFKKYFSFLFQLKTKKEITAYLELFNIPLHESEVISEELSFKKDPLFFKSYAFAKLYYSLAQSNDFHKSFQYFYITDKTHYRDVLNLTISYRKNSSPTVSRSLKLAALFHDIERYSSVTAFESLSYLSAYHDKIRKKFLHPKNTISFLSALFGALEEGVLSTDKAFKGDLKRAKELILHHDTPLDKTEEKQIATLYKSKENGVALKGLNKKDPLFGEIRTLITADSMAFFRHTYPFFILYMKGKTKENWEKVTLDRLSLSLRKVPKSLHKEVRKHIDAAIKDFLNYPDSTIITEKNKKIVLEVTKKFKKTLP